ncbi:hypothetical protein V5O48_004655 [Marasmius crinis-equi]|uniref:CBM21 domain-containing protein n=1 Tax=Marasmius crinis-equi TaxID=585013 RepID=A0ABR3FQ85_9AGAR
MIATISQSQIMSTMSTPVFDSLDTPTTQHSNSTGSPLPIIPRRGSSSLTRLTTAKVSSPIRPAISPVQITLQQATPPEDEKTGSDTTHRRTRSAGAADSVLLSPRSKARPFLKLMTPTSLPITPTPSSRTPRSKKERSPFPTVIESSSSSDEDNGKEPADDDTPRPLIVNTSAPSLPGNISFHRTMSESHVYRPGLLSLSKASVLATMPETPAPPSIIRKKSGQPVKSSLKRSSFSGSLSFGPSGISSKSEPTTPTIAKAVKFDSHLERVKLFLSEQKPLAVSRDGSPTDETDSDFPEFIFGKEDKKSLTMRVVNMPSTLNMTADVLLTEMKLLPELSSVVGRIRVKNLAYQKWVAARFTFDDWQTTSEVTAKYVESASGNVDIFTFVIKLNDMLPRLEEKTMMLAIRYSVTGREIWDNNGGKNYVIVFSRQSSPSPEKRRAVGDDSRPINGDISVLRSRLEEVVQKQDFDEGLSSLQQTRRPNQRKPIPDFKTGESFASRYDFGSSFRESWVPPSSTDHLPSYATVRHIRMNSYPALSHKTPQKHIMRKRVPPGSPRDTDDTFRPSPYVPSDLEDPICSPPVHSERLNRHHQRGYFDLDFLGDTPRAPSTGFKRTPAGVRIPSSSEESDVSDSPCIPAGQYMLSASDATPRSMAGLTSENGNDFLTPSFASPLSETTPALSSPSSSSTSSSPSADEFVTTLTAALTRDIETERSHYHQFLNRFCFYTGTESGGSSGSDSNSPTEDLSRSSSSDSVEIIIAQSPMLQGYAYGPHITPPIISSGSVTPTSVASGGAEDSRCPTPVLA